MQAEATPPSLVNPIDAEDAMGATQSGQSALRTAEESPCLMSHVIQALPSSDGCPGIECAEGCLGGCLTVLQAVFSSKRTVCFVAGLLIEPLACSMQPLRLMVWAASSCFIQDTAVQGYDSWASTNAIFRN